MLQCNFCSAAFQKLQWSVFACGMLQGWGLEGWGLGLDSEKVVSGEKRAHEHELFGPVEIVPGTNPGFRLILHNGSPVCPGTIPGTKDDRKNLSVSRVLLKAQLGEPFLEN